MAGGEERLLKRRIRSVESIRKTTRAMELISGSRIVRAQQRIVAGRPYVDRIRSLAADVCAAPGDVHHRLLASASGERRTGLALVVIAADRGQCGAYNSTVLRAAETRLLSLAGSGRTATLVTVGRKAQGYFRNRGQRIDHAFTNMTDRPSYEDARAVSEVVNRAFHRGVVGDVELVSTRFLSAGNQRVERRTVVPITPDEGGHAFDYELEPDRDDLLEVLAPVLIEARIFMALLEASASEHTARQRAMKAATDNADELITTLRRVMNRVRQESITSEIMDIVGGAEALRRDEAPVPPPPAE
jgi:F-type H+-transporting ATPase subunit gamma